MRTKLWGLACAVLLGLGAGADAQAAGPRLAPSSLELRNLTGTRYSLADYRGRVVKSGSTVAPRRESDEPGASRPGPRPGPPADGEPIAAAS